MAKMIFGKLNCAMNAKAESPMPNPTLVPQDGPTLIGGQSVSANLYVGQP